MARTTEIDDAVSGLSSSPRTVCGEFALHDRPNMNERVFRAAVGFEVLESRDVALDSLPGDISWYTPLTPSWNIFTQRFQFTGIGKWLTTKGNRDLHWRSAAMVAPLIVDVVSNVRPATSGIAPFGTCWHLQSANHASHWRRGLLPWR